MLTTALPGALLPAPESGTVPLTVVNPADGTAVAEVAGVGPDAAERAVSAAAAALPGWAAASPAARSAALHAIAADLKAAGEDTGPDNLALLMTRETGKRIAESRAEIAFSADFFSWFAEAAPQAATEQPLITPGRRFRVRRVPLGVVAAITPWNFPLSIPARKIAAALAAGCTVVLKPSELTPVSALRLVEICHRHLPAGALTTVTGDPVGLTAALTGDPRVAAVSFTGSTRVGGIVAQQCAARFLPAVLELGGRGPFVVGAEADLDTALDALMIAKFRNNGASCIAANNVFVHESHYHPFVERLAERVASLRIGDPADERTELGPLITAAQQRRIAGLVADADARGARVLSGPQPPEQGFFARPAVVECPDDVALWSEEIFGPVVAVRSFTGENALVEEVNGWGYGLGGYVCDSPDRARRLASALRIGIVGINNGAPNNPRVPFGGFGASGLGREGGLSGLLEFTGEQTLSEAV
ncbi:aldehyde dehydrogenase family protein [Streptosporangium sp. NBC_01756]|uniref:aldehyde dehydrogenase family protein n=1 Tax=Streptosporangium sp. NBC_01756 TaxID=2975950 RepID=UPI002DDC69D0|nr:aldehyde dehydrogenase family protein [Streptosporangium sp. NBC_01756]WSC86874.1 aldehyde dehydrogenase family protein [Streptosporangium sp. NBC_01756]